MSTFFTPLHGWIRPVVCVMLGTLMVCSSAVGQAPASPEDSHVILVVVDGLRPDYVTPELMPNLDRLARAGVRGVAHHAAYPTVTRVNAPTIFTGRHPSGHGLLGNSVYLPQVDSERVLDASDRADLLLIEEREGRLLTSPTLAELLEAQGRSFLGISSGSAGSATLMNPTGASIGLIHHGFADPDSLSGVVDASLGPFTDEGVGGGMARVRRVIDAALALGVDRYQADVLGLWLTEPDGTAHANGMGAPETRARLGAVDAEIGRLEEGLRSRGLLETYHLVFTSDHGFATRTGSESLTDLLVRTGQKASPSSTDVIVAGDAIHVERGGSFRVHEIVRMLQASPWVGAVFTPQDSDRSGLGHVPGTVAFSAIHWDHDRSADILVSPVGGGGQDSWGVPGTVASPGVAGHGSATLWDLKATLVAVGPRIAEGRVSHRPSGNVDLTPTVLHLVGAVVPVDLDGRVLHDLLRGEPDVADRAAPQALRATARVDSVDYELEVLRSQWGSHFYLHDTRVERRTVPPATGGTGRLFNVESRVRAPHARQAPAADENHLYAIDNRTVVKYEKSSGRRVDAWEGDPNGPIIHLNSGRVRDGLLYSAHSNYPAVPMASSIEIWDVRTLEHVGSHSFGIQYGSATWIDRHRGSWWVAFAHYTGRGGVPGRGTPWTTLMRFDDSWRPLAGYVFPAQVVERFGDRSNSGGAWGPDGRLYITGHDHAEVYVLDLPEAGSTLQWVETVPVEAEGQGIAWDPSDPGVLYTILRSQETIVRSRLVVPDP